MLRALASVVLLGLAAAAVAAAAATASPGAGGEASLAQARRAGAAYRDLSAAKAAGYGILRDAKHIACIAMPGMGAMGVHYVSGTLVGDAKTSATSPEAVVYEPTAGGGRRLVALEYVVFKAKWDAHHAAPPSLFGQRFNLTPSSNRFGLPAFYSLHAWLWKHNPAGMFAMWNPTVHC